LISWELFSSAILGRFDIHYSRKNKKGFILKIGNRRSDQYSRVYQGKDFLRFEYEMKGRFIREYHSLLVSGNLKEFETKLSKSFLNNFGNKLPLRYSYLDWLAFRLRLIRNQKLFSSGLKLHYIQPMDYLSVKDRQQFFTFLQFLVYAQNLE